MGCLSPGASYQRLKSALDWTLLILDTFSYQPHRHQRKASTPSKLTGATRVPHFPLYFFSPCIRRFGGNIAQSQTIGFPPSTAPNAILVMPTTRQIYISKSLAWICHDSNLWMCLNPFTCLNWIRRSNISLDSWIHSWECNFVIPNYTEMFIIKISVWIGFLCFCPEQPVFRLVPNNIDIFVVVRAIDIFVLVRAHMVDYVVLCLQVLYVTWWQFPPHMGWLR